MDLTYHASRINNANKETAKQAYDILLAYFTQKFIDYNNKESRKLIKRITKIGGSYAEKIIKIIETPIINKEIDNEIKKAAEQAGIDGKEIHEAREFYRAVKPLFPDKFDYIVDICSGNGLNGFYWLLQGAADNISFVDIDENSHFKKLEKILQVKYELNQSGIENYNPPKNALITAIHACGSLTDKTIDLAINNDNNFAVMPCCYNADNDLIDKSLLEYFNAKGDCIDVLRINKIQEAGYTPLIRKISQSITDKNRILIGIK